MEQYFTDRPIETTVSDGQALTSIYSGDMSVSTVVQNVPQVQTVIQDNIPAISTVISAPFVEVTSVNGMTGDVTLDASIKPFQPNHYYLQDSAITHGGAIFFAKTSFNSSSSFNLSDWDSPEFIQAQADWNELNISAKSYIKNKPTIPTKLTDLTNNGNFVVDANYEHTDNNFTTTLKNQITTNTNNIATNTSNISTNASGISQLSTNLTATNSNVSTLASRVTAIETFKNNIFNLVYPIGSIFLSISPTNPSTLFGGTWVAFGTGRTIVGVDISQTEFDTVEKTGGAKDVTLKSGNYSHNNWMPNTVAGKAVALNVSIPSGSTYGMKLHSSQGDDQDTSGTNSPFDILQPYITVYMFKRVS